MSDPNKKGPPVSEPLTRNVAQETYSNGSVRSRARNELPQFLRDLIDSAPTAGNGVHGWLFRVARQLHAHLPAGEILTLLESRVANCGRTVPLAEIVAAVQNALPCAWQPNGQSVRPTQLAKSKWPKVNQEQRAAIIRDEGGLAALRGLSPIPFEDGGSHTEAIVDQLFPGNPLLCCGKSSSYFDTKSREEWRGHLTRQSLIVPSAMSALTGMTKDGLNSKHTLDNTGQRRFLICEFDTGTTDEHSGLLIHLAGYAPLIVAVHSGGKSLHGWFLVNGQPDDKVLRFFRYAVSLGADPATWTRSQFVRMPDGTRDNGKKQTVCFFNPRLLEVAP